MTTTIRETIDHALPLATDDNAPVSHMLTGENAKIVKAANECRDSAIKIIAGKHDFTPHIKGQRTKAIALAHEKFVGEMSKALAPLESATESINEGVKNMPVTNAREFINELQFGGIGPRSTAANAATPAEGELSLSVAADCARLLEKAGRPVNEANIKAVAAVAVHERSVIVESIQPAQKPPAPFVRGAGKAPSNAKEFAAALKG